MLIAIPVRDEILHLLLSGHVRCYADVQRVMTRYGVDLVAVGLNLRGINVTLKVKRGVVELIVQRFADLNVLIVKSLEH